MIAVKTMVAADSLDALADHGFRRVVVAVGVFDGVHLGHQRLLGELLAMAAEAEAEPVVLTFDPHPRSVLRPAEALPLLQTLDQRERTLANLGVKAVVALPFSEEFANLPPQAFDSMFLSPSRVELLGVCVGSRWRFGAKASGNVGLLRGYATKRHMRFNAVTELSMDGKLVCSTAIRQALLTGKLDWANAMLGRNYAVVGEVARGAGLAGPELGCPTANVTVRNPIIPAFGVYAGYARELGPRPQRKREAIVAVGLAPTFHPSGAERPKVEAHLLDFTGDLYGAELELEFHRFIRPERRFPSVAELKTQIELDLRLAESILA